MQGAAVTLTHQQQVIHLELTMQPRPIQQLTNRVMQLALDRLAQVLDFYIDRTDPLSERIIEWGCTVLEGAEGFELNADTVADLYAQIHLLDTEVLVNPLDGAPLQEPIVARGAVWEAWMYQEFLKSAEGTPGVVQPHPLAQEMVAWRKALPIEIKSPELALTGTCFGPLIKVLPEGTSPHLDREVFTSSQQPGSKALKVMAFCQLASQALIKESLRTLREKMEMAAESCRNSWLLARKEIDMQRRILDEVVKQDQAELEARLKEIGEVHHETVRFLSGLIDTLRGELLEQGKRLATVEVKTIVQEEEIGKLRRAFIDKQNEVRQLRRQIKKKKGCSIM